MAEYCWRDGDDRYRKTGHHARLSPYRLDQPLSNFITSLL
jgi:hypothetical protein